MNQPAFEVLRRDAKGPFVILCDHASNHIPAELNGLGLDPPDLARHIAWDIGAAGVARELSNLFDSTAILCGTSRLVIDCNRHPGAVDLIPEISDGTSIPGNQNLTEQAKQITHRAVVHTLPRRNRGVPHRPLVFRTFDSLHDPGSRRNPAAVANLFVEPHRSQRR